jgi:hypothetical protein
MPLFFYFPMIVWAGLMGIGSEAARPAQEKARR